MVIFLLSIIAALAAVTSRLRHADIAAVAVLPMIATGQLRRFR